MQPDPVSSWAASAFELHSLCGALVPWLFGGSGSQLAEWRRETPGKSLAVVEITPEQSHKENSCECLGWTRGSHVPGAAEHRHELREG